nr:hypothetical protein [Rubrobacter taiwanensis]
MPAILVEAKAATRRGGMGEALEQVRRYHREGEIILRYLDESVFYLCLPSTHTWTKKGQAYQHRVKRR